MAKYNMTFEEAQEYISKRGFDVPWNDCDVFVDERYITQSVANVLKWADDNPIVERKQSQFSAQDRNTIDEIIHIRKDVLMKKLSDAFCDACGHFTHSVPNHICRLDCIYYKEFMKAMEV